jgi:glucosamine--fructose-6-phosphate aminotransferase (isomerizing)
MAKQIRRVYLIACGTSSHAAMVGRYYLEDLARIPTVVELASEFRNRNPVVGPGDLVIAISQSGETLDTLMAAKIAKQRGAWSTTRSTRSCGSPGGRCGSDPGT